MGTEARRPLAALGAALFLFLFLLLRTRCRSGDLPRL